MKNGKLFLDFRYKGIRCKEYTKLEDTSVNRKRLNIIMERVDAEITLGIFEYGKYFPASNKLEKFQTIENQIISANCKTNLFKDFAETWYAEMEHQWRNSYKKAIRRDLDVFLIPAFGQRPVELIKKAEILTYRGKLVQRPGSKSGTTLSASRINHIMTPLRMILTEAADRYEFVSPWQNIKPMKTPRVAVEPFDLNEVRAIIDHIRADFKSYYTVRFFTGLRSAEIDGLPWTNVDFQRRQILVHQAYVEGEIVPVKNDGSFRVVDMSDIVYEALQEQLKVTKGMTYVFCNAAGNPLDRNEVTKRVWYPLLRYLGLKKRRPYQSRHTAATLWLASGESPEWIARQMGHTTTEMLFTVYSRYVPNLTRQDGSAFDRLLEKQFVREGELPKLPEPNLSTVAEPSKVIIPENARRPKDAS